MNRRLGGRREEKILGPTGTRTPIVQPVVSRYTDYAFPLNGWPPRKAKSSYWYSSTLQTIHLISSILKNNKKGIN
jgi:hypothetical protein